MMTFLQATLVINVYIASNIGSKRRQKQHQQKKTTTTRENLNSRPRWTSSANGRDVQSAVAVNLKAVTAADVAAVVAADVAAADVAAVAAAAAAEAGRPAAVCAAGTRQKPNSVAPQRSEHNATFGWIDTRSSAGRADQQARWRRRRGGVGAESKVEEQKGEM